MEKHGKNKFAAIIGGIILAGIGVSLILLAVIYKIGAPAYFNPVVPESGDGTGFYRHCYDSLNENEKLCYGVVLEQLPAFPEKIEVPELAAGELDNVFLALSYDNPELFYMGLSSELTAQGRKTFFSVEYTMTKEQYTQALSQLEKMSEPILAGARNFTSEYERELYVHDYLINHCTYTLSSAGTNTNTAYGCIVEGSASCEGYSRAFQYLLNKLDIDNRLVTGEASDNDDSYIGHMWSYVNVEGIPYFVDVTWDDPSTDSNVLRHTYFNITTEQLLKRHRNLRQKLSLCTDTKYNFYHYEGSYIDTAVSGFSEIAENVIYNSIQRGYSSAEFRFSDPGVQRWANDYLLNSHTGVIYGIYSDAGLFKNNQKNVFYSDDEETGTLSLYF